MRPDLDDRRLIGSPRDVAVTSWLEARVLDILPEAWVDVTTRY